MDEWGLTWMEDPSLVVAMIESTGAQVRSETTLARSPGARHWHFGWPGQKGTLELTWDPKARRMWFKVAAGRWGPWIEAVIQEAQRRWPQ